MRATGFDWRLPLLAKDLVEYASRPRTFMVRGVYVVLLVFIGFMVLVANAPSELQSATSLGNGRWVFVVLTALQEIGLLLLVPVLAAATLTREKERKTLDLLLITRLGKTTIILEKWLSVMVLAINVLLMSLPVLAFTYAYGGLEASEVWKTFLELFLLAARLSAIGVMCSAACATMTHAAYATFLLYALLQLAEQLLLVWLAPRLPSIRYFVPMDHQFDLLVCLRTNIALADGGETMWWGGVVSLAISGACLVVARWLISTPYRRTKEWLSRRSLKFGMRNSFHRTELTPREGNIDLPVAWRESPRGSLQMWWWRNGVIAAAIPCLVVAAIWPYITMSASWPLVFGVMNIVMWLVPIPRIALLALDVLPGERARQTLDVLCTTPMTAEEIISQKLEKVWRQVNLWRISLAVSAVLRTLLVPSFLYLLLETAILVLIPQVIVYPAVKMGLNRSRGENATLYCMLSLAVWWLAPLLLLILGEAGIPFASVSPIMMIGPTESVTSAHMGSSQYHAFVFITVGISALIQLGRVLFMKDWIRLNGDVCLRGYPFEHLPGQPSRRPLSGELAVSSGTPQAAETSSTRVSEPVSENSH